MKSPLRLLAVTAILIGLLAPGIPAADAGGAKVATIAKLKVAHLVVGLNGKAHLHLTWKKAKHATSYQLVWSTSARMKKKHTVKAGGASAWLKLKAGHNYYFRARGVAGKHKGKLSPVLKVPMPIRPGATGAPYVTKQTIGSNGKVSLTLTWSGGARSTAYQIFYATNYAMTSHPKSVVVKGTASGAQTGVVSGLATDVAYTFQIAGKNASGVSKKSARHSKVTLHTTSATSTDSLKVATLNVCGNAAGCLGKTSYETGIAWTKRITPIAQEIESADADLVSLQEIGASAPSADGRKTSRQEDIVHALSAAKAGYAVACGTQNELLLYKTSVFGAPSYAAGFGQFGWATSRTGTYYGTEEHGAGITADDGGHGACWAQLPLTSDGRLITAAAVHLWNPDKKGADDTLRGTEMQAVIDQVEARNARSKVAASSTLYAGDFNSTRSHATDAPRIKLADASGNFRDGYDVAETYAGHPDWNSATNFETTPRSSVTWGDHIDRVFASAGAVVTAWHQYATMKGSKYASPMPSDHNLVAVTLTLAAP